MMKIISCYDVREKLFVLACDILLILSAFIFAQIIASHIEGILPSKPIINKIIWGTLVNLFIFPIMFYIFELYKEERWLSNGRLFVFITAAVACGSAILSFFSYVLPNVVTIDKITFGFHTLFCISSIFVFRKVALRFFYRKNKKKENILLIGNGNLFDDIIDILKSKKGSSAVTITRVKEYEDDSSRTKLCEEKTGTGVHTLIRQNNFSTVVVSTDLMNYPNLKKQLIDLRFSGVKVYDSPYYYEAITNKVAIHHISDLWFLFRNQGTSFKPTTYFKVKKVIEKIIALFLLLMLSPVMVLIAVIIRLSSPGSILFTQERMGIRGKIFTLFKFRSMFESKEKEHIPVWLQKKTAARVTRFGKILRKTRLDELPQLYNVLKGDMSFIGPRPICKKAADLLSETIPHYQLRFIIKPGLTGWAQVSGDYGATVEGQLEKLAYDLYYIQNQSALFDLLILLKTIRSVIFCRGQ